jgi:hypothetical protein
VAVVRDELEACHRLYRRGVLLQMESGDLVARGFADVGVEEFYLLPDRRVLSLTTGEKTDLVSDDRSAFFLIPSVDDIVLEIERHGGSVEQIARAHDGSGWCVTVAHRQGERGTVEAASLFRAMLRALGLLVGIDPFREGEFRLRLG